MAESASAIESRAEFAFALVGGVPAVLRELHLYVAQPADAGRRDAGLGGDALCCTIVRSVIRPFSVQDDELPCAIAQTPVPTEALRQLLRRDPADASEGCVRTFVDT